MADTAQTALVLVANPVSGDSRVLRTAGTLRDLGFDVTIVGVTSKREPATAAELDGFRVIRLTRLEAVKGRSDRNRASETDAPPPKRASSGRGTRFRTLRRLAWTGSFYLQGIALVRRASPALVHANDYNTMWIGVAAKLLRRSRLVYDSHELWPDRNGPEWRPWLLLCEWVFVRAADARIASNPAIAETLARRYHVRRPTVVRNVAGHVARASAPPEGLRAAEPPLVVHVGNLTPGRGVEQLIESLPGVPAMRLVLMGRCREDFRARLDELAGATGVADRLEYRRPVDPDEVAEAIAGADIGAVLTQPVCLNNVLSLPNKLFEYAAAGLPLVASDLPVIGAIVRENGLGEAVPPTDVDAIAAALRRLSDPDRNAEVRERVRVFAEGNTWARERRLLEDVYLSVTGDRDG